MENFTQKYTLKEWVKHPTTILLAIAVNVIWILIFMIVNGAKDTAKDANKECLEQVAYLRDRVEKLEKQLDNYTRTIMFKEAQIKNRDLVIDSLRYEK